MKSIKVAKMNLQGVIKPTVIFYSILGGIVLLSIIANYYYTGTIEMNGVDLATAIFLFICGLNSFKANFYFAQSNNIARKTFMKGIVISSVPLVLSTSIIDFIINRIANIFMKIPTLYDMGFGGLSGSAWLTRDMWVQSNDISTIFKTILFQFSLCLVAYLMGIVINMIYYRCNKLMKTVVSVLPIALIIIMGFLPFETMINIERFANYLMGVNPLNVYAPITTFLVGAVILSAITFLLIRKATIKERG